MTIVLTAEQNEIVGAELGPLSVIACAGSGKTTTAVKRLAAVRAKLGNCRGYVALLSFSNVAVDTFRLEFGRLAAAIDLGRNGHRVRIETVDAFITSHVLRTHASRFMGCTRQPFLVTGREPFLDRFKIWNGTFKSPLSELRMSVGADGALAYFLQPKRGGSIDVDPSVATKVIECLGKVGAYNHEIGRYWALRVLTEEPQLLRALARRYPHILIDEAQDIGSVQARILSLLSSVGSHVSLIGDPNQAIYEFADADGSFLRCYGEDASANVRVLKLVENRRSVASIVAVADSVSGAVSVAARSNPTRTHGAYFMTYMDGEEEVLLKHFTSILDDHGYVPTEAAVVCRGTETVEKLRGGRGGTGTGATKLFVNAVLLRDKRGDVAKAFAAFVEGLMQLLADPPKTLQQDILTGNGPDYVGALRQIIWRFFRAPEVGLPSARLSAAKKWHPELNTTAGDGQPR